MSLVRSGLRHAHWWMVPGLTDGWMLTPLATVLLPDGPGLALGGLVFQPTALGPSEDWGRGSWLPRGTKLQEVRRETRDFLDSQFLPDRMRPWCLPHGGQGCGMEAVHPSHCPHLAAPACSLTHSHGHPTSPRPAMVLTRPSAGQPPARGRAAAGKSLQWPGHT